MPKERTFIRAGQISTINIKTGSARIAHDDANGKTSNHLQMLYPAMGKWRTFWIPQPGDHAASLHLPNGRQEGFIAGTYYTAANMPVDGAEGVVQLVTVDGESCIRLNADGTITMKLKEQYALKTSNAVFDVETLTIKARSVRIEAGNIELAGEVRISGDVEIDGNLTVSGDITNKGDMFTEGTHTDSIGRHDARGAEE